MIAEPQSSSRMDCDFSVANSPYSSAVDSNRFGPERPRFLSDMLIFSWLFVASGALFPLLQQGAGSGLTDSDSEILRWLLLPNLLLAPILFMSRISDILVLLRSYWPLPILLAWIWVSASWSVLPDITIRRALVLTANTMIACFVAATLPPAAIVRRCFAVTSVLIGLSLLFAAAWPSLGFMPDLGGPMRGVFTHKNGLGFALVLAAVLSVVGLRTAAIPRTLCIATLVTVMTLVLPTNSSTTLMLLVLLAALQAPFAVIKLPPRPAAFAIVLLGILGATAAVVLLVGRNRIFMAFGRDATLTGRTEVWAIVQDLIGQRPLTGYGYEAMFERPDFREHIIAFAGWAAPNAHNGYLELILGTGLVGLAFTLAFLLPGLINAWRRLVVDPRSVAATMACLFLPIYLFRNFSESDLVAQSDVTWILAVLAVTSLARETNSEKFRARAVEQAR